VTTKGIWGTGLLALAALATLCVWQHAPEQLASTASTAAVPPVVITPKKSAAAMPPSVTGPSKSATPPTTVIAPETVAPSAAVPPVAPSVTAPPAVAPADVAPSVVTPPVVTAPVAAAPIAEAKIETKPEVTPPTVSPVQRKVFAKPVKRAGAASVTGKQIGKFGKIKKRNKLVRKAGGTGCEFRRDQNIVKSICFNFNSDRLSTRSKLKLDAIVPSLTSGDKRYELNGFADAVGNKDYNATLSERRSQAVLKYLQSKGVDASKLQLKGNGSEEANKLRSGKNQRERRVDVRIL
jgi:outer membrane protein OmpA-like peptidoglycan-associated protein